MSKHMDKIDEKNDEKSEDSHHNSDDSYHNSDDSHHNSDDDTYSDEEIPEIWKELNDLRNKLRGYNIQLVKNYIKKELANDVVEIKKKFHQDFDNVDDNDCLKIEVLVLLGELGIQINKKVIHRDIDKITDKLKLIRM